MRKRWSSFVDAAIGALLVVLISACGGGSGNGDSSRAPSAEPAPLPPPPTPPLPPGAVHLPFSDGEGRAGQYSFAYEAPAGFIAPGYVFGCVDCIRVAAVAQSATTAAQAMAASPMLVSPQISGIGPEVFLPKLAKVNFETSSVIVFYGAVAGTSLRLTLTGAEEYADRLRIRSELCSMPDAARFNNSFDGFIVIPKRDKPAEFAPSDTTGLPPPVGYSPDFTLGQCRV